MKKTSSGRSVGHVDLLSGICGRQPDETARAVTVPAMGSWYWIGVCAGLGAAVGVLFARRRGHGSRGRIARDRAAAAPWAPGSASGSTSWQPGGWGDRRRRDRRRRCRRARRGADRERRAAARRHARRDGGCSSRGAALVVAGARAGSRPPATSIVLALPALAAAAAATRPERYAGLRTLARDE